MFEWLTVPTATVGSQRVRIGGVRYHRCFWCDRWYRAESNEKLALHCPAHAGWAADAFAEGFRARRRSIPSSLVKGL